MRPFGVLLLLVALGIFVFGALEPAHPLNVARVELDGSLPLPLASLAGVFGLGLALFGGRRSSSTGPARGAAVAPIAPSGPGPAGGDWMGVVRARARTLPLEPGASLLLDGRGAPLILRIEGAPPGRAQRAVEQLGAFVATVPLPPRLRIELVACEPPPSPWQHLVSRALSQHLDRGSFKVVPQADAVDVLFMQPDPRWPRA